MTELSKLVLKKCRLFSQNSLHICYYPDLSSSLLLLVLQFEKFRDIIFVIQALFSSYYHVQKQHVPFAVLEKRKIYSQFASEREYFSQIVIGVPRRFKRFSGQGLFLS